MNIAAISNNSRKHHSPFKKSVQWGSACEMYWLFIVNNRFSVANAARQITELDFGLIFRWGGNVIKRIKVIADHFLKKILRKWKATLTWLQKSIHLQDERKVSRSRSASDDVLCAALWGRQQWSKFNRTKMKTYRIKTNTTNISCKLID